jgi:hypothetical protein
VSLANQDASLFRNLFLRQRAALERCIGRAKGAVCALVGAAIGDVKRREEDQPRSVDVFLDLLGRREDLLEQFGTLDKGQRSNFIHRKPAHLACFGQQFADL